MCCHRISAGPYNVHLGGGARERKSRSHTPEVHHHGTHRVIPQVYQVLSTCAVVPRRGSHSRAMQPGHGPWWALSITSPRLVRLVRLVGHDHQPAWCCSLKRRKQEKVAWVPKLHVLPKLHTGFLLPG